MAIDEAANIREAIMILDVLKLRVVHENLDAWLVLCHAKFYLQGRLYLAVRNK